MFFMIKADDKLRLLFSVISISELCYAKHNQAKALIYGSCADFFLYFILILDRSIDKIDR